MKGEILGVIWSILSFPNQKTLDPTRRLKQRELKSIFLHSFEAMNQTSQPDTELEV